MVESREAMIDDSPDQSDEADDVIMRDEFLVLFVQIENNEQNLNSVCSYLDAYIQAHEKDSYGVEECKYLKHWLKSLRPHWKPKEEQIKALEETIDFAPESFKPRCTLQSLLKQLKAL